MHASSRPRGLEQQQRCIAFDKGPARLCAGWPLGRVFAQQGVQQAVEVVAGRVGRQAGAAQASVSFQQTKRGLCRRATGAARSRRRRSVQAGPAALPRHSHHPPDGLVRRIAHLLGLDGFVQVWQGLALQQEARDAGGQRQRQSRASHRVLEPGWHHASCRTARVSTLQLGGYEVGSSSGSSSSGSSSSSVPTLKGRSPKRNE